MYVGKTLFAQIMDFLPWKTFHRIVARYGGDHRVRTLSCAEQFRVMAFAQLTFRESLRDIEVCLAAQSTKLYHMGFREPIKRSTLADANEGRDWRIYADFAQVLIRQARKLYVGEPMAVDLDATVYALDSTTIDLCLALFAWAPFRSTKAAVKLHTLIDLRGNIPTFIEITDGKVHDVNVLDLLIPEAGAYYVMDRGYVDFERLYALHQAGASSSRAPSAISMLGGCTRCPPIARQASCATRPSPSMASKARRTTRGTCAASASKIQRPARPSSSSPTRQPCPRSPSARSTRAAGRSSCSSNGSSSIFGSSGSMETRPMR